VETGEAPDTPTPSLAAVFIEGVSCGPAPKSHNRTLTPSQTPVAKSQFAADLDGNAEATESSHDGQEGWVGLTGVSRDKLDV
jgi:hypothetical protein